MLLLAYEVNRLTEIPRNMELVVHDIDVCTKDVARCIHERLPHIHSHRFHFTAMFFGNGLVEELFRIFPLPPLHHLKDATFVDIGGE